MFYSFCFIGLMVVSSTVPNDKNETQEDFTKPFLPGAPPPSWFQLWFTAAAFSWLVSVFMGLQGGFSFVLAINGDDMGWLSWISPGKSCLCVWDESGRKVPGWNNCANSEWNGTKAGRSCSAAPACLARLRASGPGRGGNMLAEFRLQDLISCYGSICFSEMLWLSSWGWTSTFLRVFLIHQIKRICHSVWWWTPPFHMMLLQCLKKKGDEHTISCTGLIQDVVTIWKLGLFWRSFSMNFWNSYLCLVLHW